MHGRKPIPSPSFDLIAHPRCNERLRQFLNCVRDLLEESTDDAVPNKIREHQLRERYPALRRWLIELALILALGRRKGRPNGRKVYS
jgi:hypothetical protein